MKILVTGGCGFIGCNLVRYLLQRTPHEVVNLDKLTYAGNLESLDDVANHPRYSFVQADLCDAEQIRQLFARYSPDAVMHLAAESHVDRSIDGPAEFIHTNVVGTFNLLQATQGYYEQHCKRSGSALKTDASVEQERGQDFRFLHVSTDEVFGSLGPTDPPFNERTAYDPHSPYSASKAGSDHLARAWHHTYGLPVLVTNCSNNYGPFQFPEKLIPVVILKALRGEPIPVYGRGENIRDWLYVEDHVDALYQVLTQGRPGETYAIGGNNEQQNITLVRALCQLMDELNPEPKVRRHEELITFVTDRPGHDLRYAIDSSKLRRELGWQPREDQKTGLRKTVQWYLANRDWWTRILSGKYKLERLGSI